MSGSVVRTYAPDKVLVLVGGGIVAAPAAIAVVVAFSLTYGLGLFPPKPKAAAPRSE